MTSPSWFLWTQQESKKPTEANAGTDVTGSSRKWRQSATWRSWQTAAKYLLRYVAAHTGRVRSKRYGTRTETRFRLSPKRTGPFKSAGVSVQSTAESRGVRISISNAGYTMFRGSVRVLATHSIRQFPFHFPSRASPCAIRFQTNSTRVFAAGTSGHITQMTNSKTNSMEHSYSEADSSPAGQKISRRFLWTAGRLHGVVSRKTAICTNRFFFHSVSLLFSSLSAVSTVFSVRFV